MTVLCQERGKHPVRVFTYKDRPIKKVGTKSWRRALDRAGIRAFDDGLPVGDERKRYPW